MNAKMIDGLLPAGRDVMFADIEVTLARLVRDGRRRKRSHARALTATVIVVGTQQRLVAAADALEQLGETGGVRAILISEGTHTEPVARITETAIAISGLAPKYLNNAVAALRLSSLPAVVWWRGGSVEAFGDLADLADRFIVDTEQPDPVWTQAVELFERTALTDLRWTALTRWRAALAHLFDLPQVRRGASGLQRLTIDTVDRPSARLFAGWLRAALRPKGTLPCDIRDVKSEAPTPLACVRLEGGGLSIALQVRESNACLEAAVNAVEDARIVPLGEGTLASLVGEELGVRTRDTAFEEALVAAREIPA